MMCNCMDIWAWYIDNTLPAEVHLEHMKIVKSISVDY